MGKLQQIHQSLWKLVLDLEIETERYNKVSYQILQMSLGLFDAEQRILPPDTFDKYLRITKVQPGIIFQLEETSLVLGRDLLVQSLSSPGVRNVVRSLESFRFLAQTETEKNALLLLNMLYEEWEGVVSRNKLGETFSQIHYITLPQFKFYLSLIHPYMQKGLQ